MTLVALIGLFAFVFVVMLALGLRTTMLDRDSSLDHSEAPWELPRSLEEKRERVTPPPKPRCVYQQTYRLFSAAEWRFYLALQEATPELFVIFGKVRVADVLAPQKNSDRSQWQTSFNKISGKHFDFVLCEADSGRTVCGIELNDRSHRHKKRRERDAFLQGACESARFPLLVIPAARDYDIHALTAKIRRAIMGAPQVDTPSPIVPRQENASGSRTQCPQCGNPLVKKVAQRGAYAGNIFLFCSNASQCQFYRRP